MVPCSENFSLSTKEDLVLNALFQSSTPLGAHNVVGLIRENLGCNLSLDEVLSILNKLEKNKRLVIKVERGYILTSQAEKQLQVLEQEAQARAGAVLKRWLQEDIRPAYPWLTPNQEEALKVGLIEFLNTLFLRHGIVSRNLITGGDTDLDLALDINNIVRDVCANSDIQDIALKEFPRFLVAEEKARYQFLLDLIEKAVRYLTTVCDPELLATIKQRLQGKTLYLDSNVVYRFLGLQGEDRTRAIQEVIAICKDVGFQLRVSRRTALEIRKRMELDATILRQYQVPVNLASLGYRYRTQE